MANAEENVQRSGQGFGKLSRLLGLNVDRENRPMGKKLDQVSLICPRLPIVLNELLYRDIYGVGRELFRFLLSHLQE